MNGNYIILPNKTFPFCANCPEIRDSIFDCSQSEKMRFDNIIRYAHAQYCGLEILFVPDDVPRASLNVRLSDKLKWRKLGVIGDLAINDL